MPKNSRRIGAAFEREAAKLCRDYWHSDAYRTAQRCGNGGTADVTDALDFAHVEVKKRESMAFYKHFDQANEDRTHEQYPVLLLRANRRPFVVCFQIDDTERFVADWIRNYKSSGASSELVEQAWDDSLPDGGEHGLHHPESD